MFGARKLDGAGGGDSGLSSSPSWRDYESSFSRLLHDGIDEHPRSASAAPTTHSAIALQRSISSSASSSALHIDLHGGGVSGYGDAPGGLGGGGGYGGYTQAHSQQAMGQPQALSQQPQPHTYAHKQPLFSQDDSSLMGGGVQHQRVGLAQPMPMHNSASV